MGGAASKPGFPASSEERLDGDLLEEEEEEEEKYFSAQKVREKDDDDDEEEMTTISETSSETQRAREEARDPGSATAKKSPREQKGRSSVSSLPRLLFTTTDDDDDDETKRKAKRGRSPSEEGEETPPKQSATTVKKSKMIEVAKFSTTKSSEIAKRKKKKTPDTPHLSVGLSVPASSKHRLELELKRLDAVTVATKLEFVGGPNYPTTRRSEQFKKHRLRSTSKRGKRASSLVAGDEHGLGVSERIFSSFFLWRERDTHKTFLFYLRRPHFIVNASWLFPPRFSFRDHFSLSSATDHSLQETPLVLFVFFGQIVFVFFLVR